METTEELMNNNFQNIIKLLELLYKRVIEQEILLNDIKIFLASRNEIPEEQNSFNPLDFLLPSENEESQKEIQEESSSTTVNNESLADNSAGKLAMIEIFSLKQ